MIDRKESERPGTKEPTREEIVGLYRRAFAEFGARALWSIKEFDDPTVEQVLAITRQLRTEGDMSARRLAERIEQAARGPSLSCNRISCG